MCYSSPEQLGIVILTCGTIISGIYYSFYGNLSLQVTYMSMFCAH